MLGASFNSSPLNAALSISCRNTATATMVGNIGHFSASDLAFVGETM
jgi:hypothetical protein